MISTMILAWPEAGEIFKALYRIAKKGAKPVGFSTLQL
jgi:hypothetical protein